MEMTTASIQKHLSRRTAGVPLQQIILAGLLVIELAVFGVIGTNFFSVTNFFEISRLSVELGLLALAMTPVIVTGGIDLSVGSTLGLCAVVFGKLWRDGHVPIGAAIIAALLVGLLGGLVNASIITRLKVHPLIVTLGTFSMFRGIAMGITKGSANYTDFPARFLFLGNGYFGPIPAQLPILVVAAVIFYLLLHRSIYGRAWSAIGFSPDGARYAGIPVDRRIAATYLLAGLCSAIAAIIYVARVGQAKADAGTGYELSAITAVVLGGTSIFGGRGSIIGTLLGLFAIAILKNGLRLADLPPELADVLSGVMLLVAIGLDRFWMKPAAKTVAVAREKELDMKNSQLAVLCAVILLAAFIIVGANYGFVKGLAKDLTDNRAARANAMGRTVQPSTHKAITIGMMPKFKGAAYFIACRKGAQEAADQLGDTLLWDGPTESDPAKQNEVVETWITRGVDVIAVSVDNADGLSTALRKARAHGIKVITWDADADPDARDFFVNQATPQGIGYTLMDDAAKLLGNKGKFAIITAQLTATNQNAWIKFIKERLAAKYPGITLADVLPSDDNKTKANEAATAEMNLHPDVKVLIAISSEAVKGAADAVQQSGRSDVKVVGLGTPNDNKIYVHAGITPALVLWNTMDLGYLTVYAADALGNGTLKAGDKTLEAGRLGKISIEGDDIMLGKPFTFTKDNIDKFDF
jgi:rhamnose transport system substrate-binding protein